ncbi:MAG: hypothetical protein R2865_12810 [Deinococcales bacterium]
MNMFSKLFSHPKQFSKRVMVNYVETLIFEGWLKTGDQLVSISVISVAKHQFADTAKGCEVYRSKNKKALFMTSKGIDQSLAKERIQKMQGKYR